MSGSAAASMQIQRGGSAVSTNELDLFEELARVRVVEAAGEAVDDQPGEAARVGLDRSAVPRGVGRGLEHRGTGSVRLADVIDDRRDDREHDALLDADEDHGQQ